MDRELGDSLTGLSEDELAKLVASLDPIAYSKIDEVKASTHFRLQSTPEDGGHGAARTSLIIHSPVAFMPKFTLTSRMPQCLTAGIELVLAIIWIVSICETLRGSPIFVLFCGKSESLASICSQRADRTSRDVSTRNWVYGS